MEQQPSSRWQVGAFNRETNEWDKTWLEAYHDTPEITEDMFVRQSPPLRVNMTKRQKPEGEFETHLFYGDTHHPFQDERAMNLAQLAVRELMPDSVTFIGDDNDMAMFSKFETRNEWLESTQRGIDSFSERLARVRADIGETGVINALQGNHEIRLEREIRRFNGELLGLRQADIEGVGNLLGVLTMEFLLRCQELNVNYHDGYPEQEVWFGDDLKAYHGRKTSQNSVVGNEIKSETVNFIHGHGHKFEMLMRTFRDGRDLKTIFGVQLGSFADQEQIPSGSYSRTHRGESLRQAQNWDKTMLQVMQGEAGTFAIPIPITDEGILLNGKWYGS